MPITPARELRIDAVWYEKAVMVAVDETMRRKDILTAIR